MTRLLIVALIVTASAANARPNVFTNTLVNELDARALPEGVFVLGNRVKVQTAAG